MVQNLLLVKMDMSIGLQFKKGAWFNLFLLISVVCHLTHVGEHPCTIGEDLRDSKSLEALFHALNNK